MRYRVVLAYDGTAYQGFQRQTNGSRSIQTAVEKAIAAVTSSGANEQPDGQAVRVLSAARTDTGVHAAGQVITFELDWQHLDWQLLSALNAELPGDIAVQRLDRVDRRFHPRFDAISRTYRYVIYEALPRNPLYARTAWHIRERLDVSVMQQAAAALIGEHDFATFGNPTQGTRTVRTVYLSSWEVETLDANTRLLSYTVEANGFLHHMVRVLVGTMAAMGMGRLSSDEFLDAFRAADRSRALKMAAPHGLTLMAVRYPAELSAAQTAVQSVIIGGNVPAQSGETR